MKNRVGGMGSGRKFSREFFGLKSYGFSPFFSGILD